jgi:Flp pilus assembly pilin Flp
MSGMLLKIFMILHSLIDCDGGQDLAEYALLTALIALAAISGVNHVATAVTKVFSNVSSSLA